jgi:membrane protein
VRAAGFPKRVAAAWRQAHRRHGWLDHLVRAGVRYDHADGGGLAAAVTYYAFFTTFALALLGFAIFGFLLDDPAVLRSVQRYLAQNLPSLDVRALRHARGTVGVIAFVGLPVTGWFWVDALRSSIRKVWGLPEYPGALVVRVFFDIHADHIRPGSVTAAVACGPRRRGQQGRAPAAACSSSPRTDAKGDTPR